MPRTFRTAWLLPALLVAATFAEAQPGPGGPGPGPGAASAPRMGMGPGGPGRGGMGMRARIGPDTTPGWSLMTPEERNAHRQRMSTFKTQGECTDYMAQHHQQMSERAKERGQAVPGQPRRNPCAGLP